MRDEHGTLEGATLSVFGAAVVIGGANFLAVKVTVDELDPIYGAAGRFGLAGLAFFAILALARGSLPRGAALVGAAVYGALAFGGVYALMYLALVELSVGVASVLMASAPVFTLALATLARMEPLTARGLAGAVLAIAGIGVLSLRSFDGEVPFGYLVAAILAPILVAASTIVAKRVPRSDPVATNAVGMVVGAALLVPVSLVAGETWALPQSDEVWAATAWLVLAGSVGLFWCILFVVKRWTASASTYALPLMPVVAVALAALFLDEGFGLEEAVGGLLVIAGAYLGSVHGTGRPATEPPRLRARRTLG